MTLRPRLAMAAVWPWRTLGRWLALWSAASRRPGPVLRRGPFPRPGPGERTERARIGELGELGRGRDRPHQIGRRNGRRVTEVQRRPPAGRLGAITDRAEPAGVTDDVEPIGPPNPGKPAAVTDGVQPIGPPDPGKPAAVTDAVQPIGVTDRPELTRVADRVEPVGPPNPGKPAAVADTAELACVTPAPRSVKLVAGDFASRLRAAGRPAIGTVPRQSRPPGRAGICRLRRPRTPRLRTLSIPGPVIAAPTPVAHPFLPVQSLSTLQPLSCRTGLWPS